MSMPAALGWVIVSAAARDLPDLGMTLRLRTAMACSINQLECGAASGTSSCSLSQTGYRLSGCKPLNRFTNVAWQYGWFKPQGLVVALFFWSLTVPWWNRAFAAQRFDWRWSR
jgi:hypothetical protein